LVVVSPVRGVRNADGHWVLTEKFVTGIAQYVGEWQGEVVVLLQASRQTSDDLGSRTWTDAELPCHFEQVDFAALRADDIEKYPQCAVLMYPGHLLGAFAKSCRKRGLPVTLVVELSLRTILDIARVSNDAPVKRIRAMLWAVKEYVRWLWIASRCRSIHCNGVPAYRSMRRVTRNALLSYDTRSSVRDMATDDEVSARVARARRRESPRLLFSGRLIAIKGVDWLVDVATELERRAFPFELWVAGDGDRREALQEKIVATGLEDRVRFLGVLDFHDGLLPLLKREVDLFVCTHVQGDPSCTYLETFSAGVPIVGFDNEALAGVVEYSGAGWVSPMGDARALVTRIVQVWDEEDAFLRASLRAVEFAREHSFESEFHRRVVDLQQVCS